MDRRDFLAMLATTVVVSELETGEAAQIADLAHWEPVGRELYTVVLVEPPFQGISGRAEYAYLPIPQEPSYTTVRATEAEVARLRALVNAEPGAATLREAKALVAELKARAVASVVDPIRDTVVGPPA